MLMERRLAVLHEEIGLEAGEPTRGVDEVAKVTRKRVGYVRRDVGRSAVQGQVRGNERRRRVGL